MESKPFTFDYLSEISIMKEQRKHFSMRFFLIDHKDVMLSINHKPSSGKDASCLIRTVRVMINFGWECLMNKYKSYSVPNLLKSKKACTTSA